jgi:uncharacterized protein
MFIRIVLYMLLAVVLISVLRMVIGVLTKGLAMFLNAGQSNQPSRPTASNAPPVSGDLHRDPVCGTFVADSTPYQKKVPGKVYYYCSDRCRDQHALVAR